MHLAQERNAKKKKKPAKKGILQNSFEYLKVVLSINRIPFEESLRSPRRH